MAYDTIHNIASKTQSHFIRQPSGALIAQKKTSYDWNEYRYDGAQPHAPTHIGERTFTYDLNGNQTGWTHDRNGTRRTITWDEENRIQAVADNGHTMTYKYDDAGERVIKQGPQGETVYVNQFFTIRNREAGTKHVFAGATRAVSKLMKQPQPDGTPTKNANSAKSPVEKDLYFYHPDHLGSSSYITDARGGIYEHLEYFPFGETWVEESTNTQRTPYLFTGKELDEETQLYYYGARYYDPRTSVWQSPDPALSEYLGDAPAGGVQEPKNLSLYIYSWHNPIILKDPDGQETVFMGGAGDNGLYKADFTRALREAGVSNVRTTTPPITASRQWVKTIGLGLLVDAVATTKFNQDSGYLMHPALIGAAGRRSTNSAEQYNLIGYSWGAAIMAQYALYESELRGNKVDNLVLIGAPINQSLVDRLESARDAGRIGSLIFINLNEFGDPVYPGISDLELIGSTPELAYQMLYTGSGHFYYSQETPEGAQRRDELARELVEGGLE